MTAAAAAAAAKAGVVAHLYAVLTRAHLVCFMSDNVFFNCDKTVSRSVTDCIVVLCEGAVSRHWRIDALNGDEVGFTIV